MEYEKFTSFCDKKNCLRKTIYNPKTCIKESKRLSCFEKYTKKINQNIQKIIKVDEEELEFRKRVWERDYGSFPDSPRVDNWKLYCRYWLSLSISDRLIVEENYKQDLYLNHSLDVAHIKGKGAYPHLKYDPSNALLIGHLFHNLIDTYINPLTKKAISKKQRDQIFFDMLK